MLRFRQVVLLFIISQSLFSQQYGFENLTLEKGLPQATIYCIFQDSRGYIWLGTEGSGACRYDGKTFEIFGQEKGMAGQVVRTIIEDEHGSLWFGTDEGISVFDGIEFRTVNEQKGLSSNTVVCLYKDRENNIWAGTAGEKGGLNKINYKNPDSLSIKTFSVIDGLRNNSVFALYEDNYCRLWAGTFGGGLSVLSEKGVFNQIDFNNEEEFPSNHILCMIPDGSNTVWIGTYDKGIFKISISEELKICSYEKQTLPLKTAENPIWSILPLSNEIWAGSNENGVLQYSSGKSAFINSSNGLLKNQVLGIYKDREENIWVSVADAGISRFIGKKFYQFSKNDGLTDENVYSMVNDKNGNTWIGTYGGGLFRLAKEKDGLVFKNFKVKDGLPDNIINSLDFDSKGNLWIATPKGIAKFNGRFFITYNEEKDGLINNEVNKVYVDRNDIIWCGTRNGISVFDGIGFKNTKEHYLPNQEIQTILQDKNSNIWCGTLGGLVQFHGSSLTTYDEVEGLIHKKIHSLVEDFNGNIWIGTFGGGIYLLKTDNEKKKSIKQIIPGSMLTSSNIYSLLFENDSILIAGTDNGINRILLDPTSGVKRIYKYNLKDGFYGLKSNLNAITRKDNEIWFGTVKGITAYSPEFDRLTNKKPIVHITDLKISFNEIDWTKENYNIIPWTHLPQNLKLSFKRNHVTFHYTGLFYSDKEEIKYRYRLEGLEKDWSPPRTENEAVYPGLSPGSYKFMVVAIDRFGNSSTETSTYSFVINPPFWKTVWFYSACTLLVVLLAAFYIRYRERKLIKEKEKLELIVEERTEEVVQQKNMIVNQRDKIKQQHEIVTEQKKEIMDSIHYAKRLQSAAMPTLDEVRKNLKDLFVFYKPKDIVSGDFFWFGMEDGKIILIAADCTGHGVPGALTSMLGISMLNDIIGQVSTTSPDIILNELRNNIIKSLRQSPESETKDGMDIAIVSIDKMKGQLEFAGALNPLFIIRKNNFDVLSDKYMEKEDFRLYEIKGDKMTAAYQVKMDPFRKVMITIEPDDKYYLLSDGFQDQFGGQYQRKFMKMNLKKLLLEIHKFTMDDQKLYLENALEEWKKDLAQVDDILIIGFSI